MATNPKIDAYIAKSPDWAQPILTSLRDTVHSACPEVEEEIKWGAPTFMHHGIMCGMVAFKRHCAFHFWKGELVTGKALGGDEGAAAQFGKLETIKDLPTKKALTALIKKAMALNEQGVKPAKRVTKKKAPIAEPGYFTSALAKNAKARATWEGFPPSHRREYLEWITGAKGEDTRQRRVAQAVQWLMEGKPRNWKYMK